METDKNILYYHDFYNRRLKKMFNRSEYLILKSKHRHGDSYAVCRNIKEIENATLKMCNNADDFVSEYYEPIPPDISKEQAASFKNESLLKYIISLWDQYERDLKLFKKHESYKKLFDYAKQNQDGLILYHLYDCEVMCVLNLELIFPVQIK